MNEEKIEKERKLNALCLLLGELGIKDQFTSNNGIHLYYRGVTLRVDIWSTTSLLHWIAVEDGKTVGKKKVIRGDGEIFGWLKDNFKQKETVSSTKPSAEESSRSFGG